MNRLTRVIINFCILGLLATGCSSNSWTGFYYKNGQLETDPIIQDGFVSSASCLDWARGQKELLVDPLGLYECGSSCKLDDYGTYICKETID